jgi:hypothetical protein
VNSEHPIKLSICCCFPVPENSDVFPENYGRKIVAGKLWPFDPPRKFCHPQDMQRVLLPDPATPNPQPTRTGESVISRGILNLDLGGKDGAGSFLLLGILVRNYDRNHHEIYHHGFFVCDRSACKLHPIRTHPSER